MGNPFEFTSQQNLFSFLRQKGSFLWLKWDGYQLPYCDAFERVLDVAVVRQLSDVSAFGPEHAGVKVGLPKDQSRWKSGWDNAGGQPLQAAHVSRTVLVQVREKVWVGGEQWNTGGTEYEAEVPAPAAGYLWVQGHPQTGGQLLGWNDCHARIINADGSSTEMIKAEPVYSGKNLVKIRCDGLGRYNAEGVLTEPEDRHVTAWKEGTQKQAPATRISPLMLGRSEQDHRLAMVVKGTDADPAQVEAHIGLWVALPYDSVPWDDLTPDARRVATMLCKNGAITMDHSPAGSGLVEVMGADWAGVDFGGWEPQMSEFRVVAS